jgi:hypothetical protein
MKSRIRRSVFAPLLLFFTAWAIAQVSPANPPFTIVISPVSANVTIAEGVFVKLTIRNVTTIPMDISANISDLTGVDPNYVWNVMDDGGTPVPKRKYPHPELAGGRPFLGPMLQPGSTFTRTEALSRLFDLSKPGRYMIDASRQISLSNRDAGVVRSNIITVRVSADSKQ